MVYSQISAEGFSQVHSEIANSNVYSLKLRWVKFNLWFQNAVISLCRLALFRDHNDPKRILIFRTGSIGDNICSIPSIVAIRKHFIAAEIHLLTDAGGQNLASLDRLLSPDYYNKVIDYSNLRILQLLQVIRKGRYDLVIELPQNIVTLRLEIRNMIFFRLAGIRSGFGWHVTTCFSFLQTQEKHLQFLSEAKNLLQIIESHGIKVFDAERYPLQLTDEDRAIAEGTLHKTVPADYIQNRMIALVPGAKRSQNLYPLDRFVLLAEWLVRKGYTVLVIGGQEDIIRGNEMAMQKGVFSFCGKLTPLQSAALLSKCFIAISNDTGPMHLSYAVGTPVIGLFSSRDFQNKWFPPEGNIALRNYHVHCSLCFTETCGNNICMQGIPLDAVKNAFLELEGRIKN